MIGKQLTQVDTLNDVAFSFLPENRITASLTHADLMVSPKPGFLMVATSISLKFHPGTGMAGMAGIAGISISAESLVRLVLESVIDVDDLREKVSR
jgi:hypothetical protein